MRELKFRAWDASIGQVCQVIMIWTSDGINHGLQYKTPDGGIILSTTAAREGVTLMQYTGLHDKNGEPIYEGDVIRAADQDGAVYSSDHGVGVVVWLEEWGIWYVDHGINNGLGDVCYNELVEVIGNIYQNPELLQGGDVKEAA